MRIVSPGAGLPIQDIYKMLSQRSGMLPIGAYNSWHGGIHIETDKPVVAISNSKIIAYRVTRNKNNTHYSLTSDPFYFKNEVTITRTEHQNALSDVAHGHS